LKTKTLTVGGTGAGADTDLFPKVMRDLLGYQFVPIAGYPGGSDVLLAMERGEVQGRCGWSWSSARANNPEWFEEGGNVNLLFQMSLEKHPELPDTPLVTELASTDFEAQVLNLLFARQVMGRPFLTTPNVPEDRLRALRQAFVATMQDPDFQRDMANQNLELSWVNGDRIQKIVSEAVDYPQAAIDFISAIE
jgi:tripartite-type tricarboxylate transporter receptor subunit TctC